jgi:hypothetical protein
MASFPVQTVIEALTAIEIEELDRHARSNHDPLWGYQDIPAQDRSMDRLLAPDDPDPDRFLPVDIGLEEIGALRIPRLEEDGIEAFLG